LDGTYLKTEDKEDTDLLRNSNRQLVEFKKKWVTKISKKFTMLLTNWVS
jgi:hypothetical protein